MTSIQRNAESQPYAEALRQMTLRYECLVQALSILRRVDEVDDPSRSSDDLFRRILETIAFGLAAENCSLMFIEETGEFLELRAACSASAERGVSFAPHAWHGRKFHIGEGIVGKVAATGKAIRIDDVAEEGEFVTVSESPVVVRSLLCFPLSIVGKVTGVLNLSHSEPGFFSVESENTLAFVAERVARIFSTRLLHEKLRESEVYHSLVTENANDPILVFDTEGNVRSANPAAAHVAGIPLEKFLQEPATWESRIHPDDRERYAAHRQRVLNAETACMVEYRCLGVLDKHRYIEQRSAPMRDPSGRIAGMISIARDVTDRKQGEELLKKYRNHLEELVAERSAELVKANEELQRDIAERKRVEVALEAERRHLFSVLEIIPAFVCLLGEDHSIRFANGRFLDFFGDPFGKRCYEILRGKECPCAECPLPRVLETGVGHTTELTSHKGRTYMVYDNFFPVEDDFALMLKVGIDVTEQKKTEEERRILEAQVQHTQKLESLGVLAGGVAHDFNNLLMAIVGNAELILGDIPGDTRVCQRISEILTASKRAADLCGQMLAYSGAGKYIVEQIDLTEILREMTRLLEISVSKKVTLQHRYAERLPLIKADATQIRQVIMNLISNASEAIGENPGVITITTGTRHCDKAYLRETYINEQLSEGLYVFLQVTDTGCGMDKETLQKAFEPFFTTKFTGRGLGLAAVLGIVRAHRGAIKAQSEPRKGTTFTVLFPCLYSGAEGAREPAPDAPRR